jgi:hypothetical protein
MMSNFYMKKGDTLPVLSVTLRGSDGNVFNLTGYTVLLKIETRLGTFISRTMTVSAPATGVATYTLTAADWLVLGVGLHRMEYEATNGSAVQTFPNAGSDFLIVSSELS